MDPPERSIFRLANEARNRTVGECVEAGWQVIFSCEARHVGRFLVADLEARFPAGATLEQIAARLVCATCGARRGGLGIKNDAAEQARRTMARFQAKRDWRGS